MPLNNDVSAWRERAINREIKGKLVAFKSNTLLFVSIVLAILIVPNW